MSAAYSKKLVQLAKETAAGLDLSVREGVYFGNPGPIYETPAEVRMIRTLGGDAVGMSTVPEVIVARHAGLEVLGISCISNLAAGMLDQPLTHEEVIETTEKVRSRFFTICQSTRSSYSSEIKHIKKPEIMDLRLFLCGKMHERGNLATHLTVDASRALTVRIREFTCEV